MHTRESAIEICKAEEERDLVEKFKEDDVEGTERVFEKHEDEERFVRVCCN